MVDARKLGKPWSDDELDAIVADYFSMLRSELSREHYVKSHHSAALMNAIGRTHRSVEFKHQNISAVLQKLGMPWIFGCKPKRNYQNAIIDAIDRYVTANGDAEYRQPPPTILYAADTAEIFVNPPPLEDAQERPPRLTRLIRKFDPVERDHRNRLLGRAGEEFVLTIEQKKLVERDRAALARKVRWVSEEDGDGAGYDILSFDCKGRERMIEVKTTNGAARTPFFLTRNEHDSAAALADRWRLYRVHLFSQMPRIFSMEPPLRAALQLRPETWRASFK